MGKRNTAEKSRPEVLHVGNKKIKNPLGGGENSWGWWEPPDTREGTFTVGRKIQESEERAEGLSKKTR